jgi:HlyD family secretion protein
MIKNGAVVCAARGVAAALLLTVTVGCTRVNAVEPETFQGIVELDEWHLGFELGGRIATVAVERGAMVKRGQELAKLDAALESSQRTARESDAQVADAQLALLRAGSRPEDIGSMAAQVQAARATEQLLGKTLLREQALRGRGASTDAAVDDVQGRFDGALFEHRSLEQKLIALRRGSRPEEVSAAAARAAAAAAAVQTESLRVARHEVVAPSDGVVLDVHVKAGEVVAAGAPVVSVGDSTRPYADVFVPQGGLSGVKAGTPAEVRVDGESTPFRGAVETVARKTEFTPRFLFSERERPNLVVRVRVRIQDPSEKLHAGVPARVRFTSTP